MSAKNLILSALNESLASLQTETKYLESIIQPDLFVPRSVKRYGHFSSRVCLSVAKLNTVQDSQDLSQIIAFMQSSLTKTLPPTITVASRSKGFLNFFLSDVFPQTVEQPKLPKDLDIQIVARVSSCFREKFGTPRQAGLARSSKGVVHLEKQFSPACLDGLNEFSHIWLIYAFSENETSLPREKIRPPKLFGTKRGVFATRTPHRPSKIGLSVVKLDRIESTKLFISGLDMVDQTPVLDIKPYHPLDAITDCSAPCYISDKAACEVQINTKFFASLTKDLGLQDDLPASVLSRHDGLVNETLCKLDSQLSSHSSSTVLGGLRPFALFSSCSDFFHTILETLCLDPRPSYRVSCEKIGQSQYYTVQIDNFEVEFQYLASTLLQLEDCRLIV